MSKITKSILGGLLFTFYFMCFVFPVSLVMAFSDHTPMGEFLGQQVVDFFVLWIICGVVAHGIAGLFEDINKPREPRDPNAPDASNDRRDEQPSDERNHRLNDKFSGEHDDPTSGPKS